MNCPLCHHPLRVQPGMSYCSRCGGRVVAGQLTEAPGAPDAAPARSWPRRVVSACVALAAAVMMLAGMTLIWPERAFGAGAWLAYFLRLRSPVEDGLNLGCVLVAGAFIAAYIGGKLLAIPNAELPRTQAASPGRGGRE